MKDIWEWICITLKRIFIFVTVTFLPKIEIETFVRHCNITSACYLRNSIPAKIDKTTQAPITPPAIAPALPDSFSRVLVVSSWK